MQTTDIVTLYKRLAVIPTVKSGIICCNNDANVVKVESRWGAQDPLCEADLCFSQCFHHLPSPDSTFASDPVLCSDQVVWDVVSSSGSHRAILLKEKGEKGDVFRIQVWVDGVFEKSINLTAKDKHGAVYSASGCLGAFCWSYGEGHLLYVAEAKQPKKESYFSEDFHSENIETSDDEKPKEIKKTFGEQYDFVENWGEQLTDKEFSVICSLDVDSEVISLLDNIPSGVFPCAPCWVPDDQGILFVGYQDNDPARLGLIYCEQRPSAIYYLNFTTGVCKVVGHSNRAVSSPRFSPCGKQIVWLENSAGGPHGQCQRLIHCDWPSREIRTIVDVVKQAGAAGFPGIYNAELPTRCWSSDSSTVLLHSIVRSKMKLLVVDVGKKLGEIVPVPETVGDVQVLDYHKDWLLAVFNSPTTPPYLVLSRFKPREPQFALKWVRLTEPSVMEGMAWQIVSHSPKLAHPDFGNQTFESILVYPDVIEPTKRKEGLPLLVMPHGGPHAAFTASFMKYVCGFVQCGFACLLINYRGSLGYGKNFIVSLLGRIGQQDISDCMDAINDVLQSGDFSFDKTKLAVIGGSHGGFLSAHLVGQYPGFFKAAIMRNPVINLASMLSTSDIPDWVLEECGFPAKQGTACTPNESIMATMIQKSPIHFATRVTTPSLVMIGAKDARVPPSQGKEFYRVLKSVNCPTRLLVYPKESHPIISSFAAADAFVNIVNWLNKYTPAS